jgi:hypothetical protein
VLSSAVDAVVGSPVCLFPSGGHAARPFAVSVGAVTPAVNAGQDREIALEVECAAFASTAAVGFDTAAVCVLGKLAEGSAR